MKMNWANVRLVLRREVKDQLRDRRTLFTMLVLPLLLYPLLGATFVQISQFMQEHPTRIRVLGAADLPVAPKLLDGERFDAAVCSESINRLLELTIDETVPADVQARGVREVAEQEIRAGKFDAVVYVPPSFGEQLDRFREQLVEYRQRNATEDFELQVPEPEIFVNSASDKSRIAYDRVNEILRGWREGIVRENLVKSNIPAAATEPFKLTGIDVSEEVRRRAAIWSKILPFVVLIWALTGAFQPAVDMCAGEKERGTLETLLSSPVRRVEIVWGKMLTVMMFSLGTAVLNLLSMGATGTFIMGQMENLATVSPTMQFGPPPVAAMCWLLLALVPAAALFSALSLAIAAFARSSKEGQYYLMPLLLVTLPLMLLPMLPAAELDMGTSLMPITGLMLLLPTPMAAQYAEAGLYALPVVGVTMLGCLLSIRWAIDQFNNESVLFRESEQWSLRLWFQHVLKTRQATPTFAAAMLCGILILLIRFFGGFVFPTVTSWGQMAWVTTFSQLVMIVVPAVGLTYLLTRSPRQTLLLAMPKPLSLPAAVLLAIFLHPAFLWMGEGIKHVYPISEDALTQLEPLSAALASASLWSVLLVIAVVPAICEELAFRGFILSGLRSAGHRWRALVISSFLFGITHSILQQSISAFVVGLVIGYIAMQTGSILPGMLYHFTHNALAVLLSRLTPEHLGEYPFLRAFFRAAADGQAILYDWGTVFLSAAAAAILLYWLRSHQPRPAVATQPESHAAVQVT